jgi:hypothetical protein
MRSGFSVALVLAGCLVAAPRLLAQAPAGTDPAGASQNKPADTGQKPATGAPQSSANPFPEDTSTVPVMPSSATPALPEGTYDGAESAGIPLPGEDLDPVRSPDDPAPAAGNEQGTDSSSSIQGLDRLLPPPDAEQPEKRRKLAVKEPTHQEAASKDIEVGGYYLQTRNWKAALSRFESAMVLDPENPEVYWGLAEAQHHLGDFANARANYLKVLDYDPDGPHGKDARKELKDPAIAKAQSSPPAAQAPQ